MDLLSWMEAPLFQFNSCHVGPHLTFLIHIFLGQLQNVFKNIPLSSFPPHHLSTLFASHSPLMQLPPCWPYPCYPYFTSPVHLKYGLYHDLLCPLLLLNSPNSHVDRVKLKFIIIIYKAWITHPFLQLQPTLHLCHPFSIPYYFHSLVFLWLPTSTAGSAAMFLVACESSADSPGNVFSFLTPGTLPVAPLWSQKHLPGLTRH